VKTFLRSLTFLALAALVFSCGKKGPPRWMPPEPPPPPPALSAVSREDAVILKWFYPAGEASAPGGFSILRSMDGEFGEIARTRDFFYEDRGAGPAKGRAYSVVALGPGGKLKSDPSEPVSVERPEGPEELVQPGKPAFSILGDRVDISWKGHRENLENRYYNIYRREESGKYPLWPLNVALLEKEVFSDSLYFEGVRCYAAREARPAPSGRVVAEGPPSGETCIGPGDYVPSVPAALEAAVSDGKVLLYWRESPEPWARGYRVYRAEGDGKFATAGESRTPAFTDGKAPRGRLRYRVSAVGPVAESAPSKPVDVLLP